MKLYSKISALGAVFVLTAAFASADTININSTGGAGGTTYLGTVPGSTPLNTVPVTPTIAPVGGGATFAISPGTTWSPAIGSSSWVSFDSNSGPTGTQNGGSIPYDANGFYYYQQAVTTDGGTWSGSVTVQADDTVAVYLNSISAGNLLLNYGNIGGDSHCADNPPACVMAPATFNLGSFDSGFNNDGTNELIFVVAQTGSIYQGLDVSGSISNPVPTPEPNTLFLLGTGLLGSAGTLFRKMRARA
jgi:hypothetical protein